MRAVVAFALFCAAHATQFLARGVDFDKLKRAVVNGQSFQTKVVAKCQGSADGDCVAKTTDLMFCQLLIKKNRDLAAEHCDMPDDLKFLAEKAKSPDVVKLSSGLMYKVIKNGTGTTHPSLDTPCLCNYKGSLVNGFEFDSSFKRGEPATFAPEQVIKAWTEAMQLMVEGDEWELYVPSDLGYGEQGNGDIPGGATLIFDMQLLKIQL
eukprot:CAMPEP_0183388524 /NCGR_PEP_ID=MMETSP0370-20130417/4150_1 /TAXON_ID=268820 /ORGANISM="Peridinium aciculiferum, Strain PAER-2" /LENGTH=207 /DNA_ID=CAMNT_0025567487 /DNA_START=65 /DNA_END=688 /DNA_ORIENTATION=+